MSIFLSKDYKKNRFWVSSILITNKINILDARWPLPQEAYHLEGESAM